MKPDRGSYRLVQREELRVALAQDPYKAAKKLAEPTRCTGCGAVYHRGRWTWDAAPPEAHEALCPACHRIRDKLPAGYVHLKGSFSEPFREEIVRLVRHQQTREATRRVLERIMAIERVDDGLMITTTDNHLARDIGEAIHSACKGELSYHYNKDQNMLRVEWRR